MGRKNNILFLLPYPLNSAPSQRLRFEQYMDYFRREGYNVSIKCFITPKFYKIIYKKGHFLNKILFTAYGYFIRFFQILSALQYDIIYVHLWCAPYGPPVFEYLFTMLNKLFIYDIDDLVYLPRTSLNNRMLRFFKNNKGSIILMKKAAFVIVSTEYLKKFVLRINPFVICIPSTINDEVYYVNKVYSNDRQIVVGWTGSRSTSVYVRLLESVFKRLKRKYDIRIKIIGNSDFKIKDLQIEAQDWNFNSEIKDLQEIDIGLYPLPKEDWVMGKSGGKALQYMALGIVPVAQSIEMNSEIINHGENGFLADTEDSWYEYISILIEDAALRRKIGQAGRRTVEERFSVRANAHKYLYVLNTVCTPSKNNSIKGN